MNTKRLLKLAAYLETVPRKRFKMEKWGEGRGCGFAGCALGWAIHGRLFRGFRWSLNDYPVYGVFDTHEAAEQLFALPSGHSEWVLFGPHLLGTPKQVAKRIRAYVREHA